MKEGLILQAKDFQRKIDVCLVDRYLYWIEQDLFNIIVGIEISLLKN